ncbi:MULTISPECIES: acyltransferase family protein [Bacillaceae]|uniref:Acyltransferase family protein n=1 Tax=Evansella alkalicola TaxID=745819 RepID=A0ABS6JVD9_9BACI|nr:MULTISPECIES: acyltransferase family protein [Bacillaceae]MBU9722056.1 acyltransferase family protein [Bacillus alkalicola]
MMKSSLINEIFIMRSIACLSIVFLHAIGIGLEAIPAENIGANTAVLFDSINVFLYFGTPMFIFISEFLIAYSYRNKPIPDNFLKKRFKWIFLPFLFMAFFYSIPYMTSFSDWGIKFLLNAVIGDFHGYFVLIIFQFYFLHLLLYKTLKRAKPQLVLGISFLITFGYLSIFNFTTALNIPFGDYIWDRFFWVPFLGWAFYFTLGFYCGFYYEKFIVFLDKYKVWIITAPVVSTFTLLFLYHNNILIEHSSKRVDMIFHTTAITLFMFYMVRLIRNIPSTLVSISQYSFGIYLLHMFYMNVIDYVYQLYYPKIFGFLYIVLLFLFSTFLSVATIHYMNKWKYGQYLVGKVGIGTSTKPTLKQEPARTPAHGSLSKSS